MNKMFHAAAVSATIAHPRRRPHEGQSSMTGDGRHAKIADMTRWLGSRIERSIDGQR